MEEESPLLSLSSVGEEDFSPPDVSQIQGEHTPSEQRPAAAVEPPRDGQVPVPIEFRDTHIPSTDSIENLSTINEHNPNRAHYLTSSQPQPTNGNIIPMIPAESQNSSQDTAVPRSSIQSTLDVFRPPPVLPNLALEALERLKEGKNFPREPYDEEFKPTKKRRIEETGTEDESQQCSICFEPWSNSGGHRISSLKCGHLFGQNCIEKWLQTCPKCPQCNAKAKRSDIRVIYSKAISVVDTTERDRALQDLETERSARVAAQKAEAQAVLQYQLARAECDRLKEEIKSVRQKLESFSNCKSDDGGSVECVGVSYDRQGKYELCKTISVSQSGNCRVLGHDPYQQMLVATKPSNNNLFPGYGLMKISTVDLQHSEYVPIHSAIGVIRDVVFSPRGDGMVLTAAMDKTAKLTSMQSNTVVQSFQSSHPVWACAWDSDHTHLLYCGLQNGSVRVYDTRNTTGHVVEFKRPSSRACPITSLAYVPLCRAGNLNCSGLLMGTLGGSVFWEKDGQDRFSHHPLSSLPEGACTSLSFDLVTRHCLSSFRPGRGTPYTRHILFQLSKDCAENKVSCQAVDEFKGGYTQKLLSRSRLFERPSQDGQLLVAFGDEVTKSAQVWDVGSSCKLQQLSLIKDPALDILPFSLSEQNFLSVLTESKLFVYKWTWL